MEWKRGEDKRPFDAGERILVAITTSIVEPDWDIEDLYVIKDIDETGQLSVVSERGRYDRLTWDEVSFWTTHGSLIESLPPLPQPQGE